jgi:damage-control phosphatase, subfamily I
MALAAARQVVRSENEITALTKMIMKLDCINGQYWGLTPPEIIRDIWAQFTSLCHDEDPLRLVKKKQNEALLQFYPVIRRAVFASADPFSKAVRHAVMGNTIDAMAGVYSEGATDKLAKLASQTVDGEEVRILRERVKGAEHILYFTDNCGEIVFDRILIEVIKAFFSAAVTVVVRKRPVMNDATARDARFVGLDSVADVVENDIEEPLPGTMLLSVSPRILEMIEKADLLIVKGGGNHDTMTEERSISGRTTYLFQVKCHPYSAIYRVPIGSLVIHNN